MDDNNILPLTANVTTVTPEIRLVFESHLPLDAYRLLQLAITINHSQNKAHSRILEKPLQKKAEKTIAPFCTQLLNLHNACYNLPR